MFSFRIEVDLSSIINDQRGEKKERSHGINTCPVISSGIYLGVVDVRRVLYRDYLSLPLHPILVSWPWADTAVPIFWHVFYLFFIYYDELCASSEEAK